jgi:hypothetical protein
MGSMFRSGSRCGGSLVDVNSGEETQEHVAPQADDDGLVSRLTVIEDQPLEARAAAYTQLHDQLQARLEGGDLPRSAG